MGATVEIKVNCPDCTPRDANNRAERRANLKQRRRCDYCHGSGKVTKNVPTNLVAPVEGS